MIAYASNTGTRRNLEALRQAHWRILLTPINPHLPPRLRYAIDNGAWSCFQRQEPFDGPRFGALVERHGAGADFVIAPDIVAGGQESLAFSESWMPRLKNLRLALLPIQDGMTADDVGGFLQRHPHAGLFLGGSTEYKLRTMFAWGMVAHAFGRPLPRRPRQHRPPHSTRRRSRRRFLRRHERHPLRLHPPAARVLPTATALVHRALRDRPLVGRLARPENLAAPLTKNPPRAPRPARDTELPAPSSCDVP